jgi:2,4-dienoyl-CoA reductase (NADPH2)
LNQAGIAYISGMGGTYESFSLPEIVEKSRHEGYMLNLAEQVRANVSVPIIAAGRFSSGAFINEAIFEGKTDLIGLARGLWADPQWRKTIYEGRDADIRNCNPDCDVACTQMAMKGWPAFCLAWPEEKLKRRKAEFV